ncbi:MAG TPA: hypothetical protein VMT20_03995 [Terriglobia bacterium]|nr:hypothetical protein [Terriglobia bacterium]
MIAIYKSKQLNRQILTAALLLSGMLVFSHRSFAGTVVDGCGNNVTITLTGSTNWLTLCSQKVTLPTKQNCVVTGSAEVSNNVTDEHNEYRFTVDTDVNPITGKKAERVIDVTQGSAADPENLAVSSVNDMKNLAAGTYTFRFLARKIDPADDINITAYTLGVVCSDGQ